MLFPVSELDLAHLIDSAHRTVLVQSPSISSTPVLDSLIRAKKRGADVKVLLAAKPNYAIVSGRVLIGNRPYELSAVKQSSAFSAPDIPRAKQSPFQSAGG